MYKDLGVGIGLRSSFVEEALEGKMQAQWFEVISENYMRVPGLGQGHHLSKLLKLRESYPIVLHGVSMAIGNTAPLDKEYLKNLKDLVHIVQPEWISDHICWGGVQGKNSHELLPLPYTVEVLNHLVDRIDEVQNILGLKMTFENVSSYMSYRQSEMTEWEFVNELALRSGCDLLLDVNNVYVSGVNHNFSPKEYLDSVPWDHVKQIHLAGHQKEDQVIIDTHDNFICEDVWLLYQYVSTKYGNVSTMLEWDDSIPEYHVLNQELEKIKKIKEVSNVTRGHSEANI